MLWGNETYTQIARILFFDLGTDRIKWVQRKKKFLSDERIRQDFFVWKRESLSTAFWPGCNLVRSFHWERTMLLAAIDVSHKDLHAPALLGLVILWNVLKSNNLSSHHNLQFIRWASAFIFITALWSLYLQVLDGTTFGAERPGVKTKLYHLRAGKLC